MTRSNPTEAAAFNVQLYLLSNWEQTSNTRIQSVFFLSSATYSSSKVKLIKISFIFLNTSNQFLSDLK